MYTEIEIYNNLLSQSKENMTCLLAFCYFENNKKYTNVMGSQLITQVQYNFSAEEQCHSNRKPCFNNSMSMLFCHQKSADHDFKIIPIALLKIFDITNKSSVPDIYTSCSAIYLYSPGTVSQK